MEVEFARTELANAFAEYRVASRRWGAVVASAYIRKVNFLQNAATIQDVRAARGLRLHALGGASSGLHAAVLHDRWRLVIRLEADKIVIEEVSNHYGD